MRHADRKAYGQSQVQTRTQRERKRQCMKEREQSDGLRQAGRQP